MIKDNFLLTTDWDDLYMTFNKEFDVDVFENDCADEYPLIHLLWEMNDDLDAYANIVEFFYDHYSCIWHNNITGEVKEVEKESPEFYEGLEAYRQKIMSLATYFKIKNIEDKLSK